MREYASRESLIPTDNQEEGSAMEEYEDELTIEEEEPLSLQEKEIDESILSTLSSVRFEYTEELNKLIRTKNTREMFDR